MKKNCLMLAVLLIIFSMASCRGEREELMETKISASENAALIHQKSIDSIRNVAPNTLNSSDDDTSLPGDGDTSSEGDPPPKNGQQWFN